MFDKGPIDRAASPNRRDLPASFTLDFELRIMIGAQAPAVADAQVGDRGFPENLVEHPDLIGAQVRADVIEENETGAGQEDASEDQQPLLDG